MINLLDKGYVKLVETWGSDERIIEAARMSTQKGFLGWGPVECGCARDFCKTCGGTGQRPGDEKLLRYLYEHKHHTPFEMGGMIIEVKAPIMVFREWHRHRTQSFNEMSARYTPLPAEDYVPTWERVLRSSTKSKQTQGLPGVQDAQGANAEIFTEMLTKHYAAAQKLYEDALANGIPKELARLCLPVGRYSMMRASCNLRNWMGFMTLRSAPDAQEEIRVYSDAVGTLLRDAFPRTMQLFDEGRSR